MDAIELECDLPVVGSTVRVRVHGLDPAARPFALNLWPVRSSGGRVSFELLASRSAVGLPPSPAVTARARWASPNEVHLEARAAELWVRFDGAALRGMGLFAAPHVGSLEAAFRALAILVLERRGMIVLHASAVCRGGEAILLFGESGAGKTTTARRLGREGLVRIADDMVAVDLTHEPPRVHGLRFDRHRSGATSKSDSPVARAALLVRKGAISARVLATDEHVKYFADAFIGLEPGPGKERQRLDRFAALCHVRCAEFDVPASGPLRNVLENWVNGLTEGAPIRLDTHGVVGNNPSMVGKEAAGLPWAAKRVVQRAPNVAWRLVDGVAVLVSPNSPRIHTLNAVGTRIWELADGRDEEAIAAFIVNEFKVSGTEAVTDVRAFLVDLEARGFLRRDE